MSTTTPQTVEEQIGAPNDIDIPREVYQDIRALKSDDSVDVTVETSLMPGNMFKVNVIVDSGSMSPPSSAQMLLWNNNFLVGHPRDEDSDGFTIRLFRTFQSA